MLGSTSGSCRLVGYTGTLNVDYRECDRGYPGACKSNEEMISVARIDEGTVRRLGTPKIHSGSRREVKHRRCAGRAT